MTIDEILAEFGKRSGMENLGRDGNGVCRLVFDEIFDVDIELYDDQVSIFAIIGSVEDVDGGMLRVMLAANLDGADTGNATLAVDELSEFGGAVPSIARRRPHLSDLRTRPGRFRAWLPAVAAQA